MIHSGMETKVSPSPQLQSNKKIKKESKNSNHDLGMVAS